MLYFWLLLLAHALADFCFQTDAVSTAKCKNQWQGYVWHGLTVFLCTLAAIHFYGWKSAFWAARLVTFVHIALDLLKNIGRAIISKILRREARPRVLGLFADQTLHVVTLLWVWHTLDRPVSSAVTMFYGNILAPVGRLSLLSADRIVPGLAVYILVTFGGAVLVRVSLDRIFNHGGGARAESAEGKAFPSASAGKYIGMLERVLILTLTATGNISAIGVVFAAKSIARYSELSKKQFAEYYLVGTLISFLLALAGGMALKQVL